MPSAVELTRPERTSPDTATNSSGRDAKGDTALTQFDDSARSLRPIETRYNGFRFRSRLEARWAVFFDTLAIEYQYEPEGFVLPNGERYLCDFFIPSWAAWIEIKPEIPTSSAGITKLRALADSSERAALLICGQPWPNEYSITFTVGRTDIWETSHEFRGCFGCSSPWLGNQVDVRHLGGGVPTGSHANSTCVLSLSEGWPLCTSRGGRYGLTDRLDLGFRRARAARFEFGESGG